MGSLKGLNSWTGTSAALREYRATPTEDVTKLPKLVQHVVKRIETEYAWRRQDNRSWCKAKSFATLKEAEAWVQAMNAKANRRAQALNPKAEPVDQYRIRAESLPQDAANEP